MRPESRRFDPRRPGRGRRDRLPRPRDPRRPGPPASSTTERSGRVAAAVRRIGGCGRPRPEPAGTCASNSATRRELRRRRIEPTRGQNGVDATDSQGRAFESMMPTIMSTDETCRTNNERRIPRMNVWIDLARKTSDDDDCAHVRFVFYWIAYEAGYKLEETDPSDSRAPEARQRRYFHRKIARYDSGPLRDALHRHRERVVQLLELRQASPSFWQRRREDARVQGRSDWEHNFSRRTGKAKQTLQRAIADWCLGGANEQTRNSLNDLFQNLSVVRNQIAHGASAGSRSRGRTQVQLGARLLDDLIPCFRDTIQSNLDEDWGSPPFPRVGAGPDDECPPPWLKSGSPTISAVRAGGRRRNRGSSESRTNSGAP